MTFLRHNSRQNHTNCVSYDSMSRKPSRKKRKPKTVNSQMLPASLGLSRFDQLKLKAKRLGRIATEALDLTSSGDVARLESIIKRLSDDERVLYDQHLQATSVEIIPVDGDVDGSQALTNWRFTTDLSALFALLDDMGEKMIEEKNQLIESYNADGGDR